MSKNVTMSEIAEKAGVSKRTVSAVLNPKEGTNVGFSEETAKKIKAVAEELDYRPNRTVQSFFSKKHRAIGLLTEIDSVNLQVLKKMLRIARNKDVMLIIEEIPENPQHAPRLMAEDCVDALIIFAAPPASYENYLSQMTVPVIQVNTNTRTGKHCITYDEEKACKEIVQMFKAQGIKQTLFFTPLYSKGEHYSHQVRQSSFFLEMENAGLPKPMLFELPPEVSSNPQTYRGDELPELLKKHSEIDAVVMYNDFLGFALYWSAMKAGRIIGKDLKVISFGNSLISDAFSPSLTTFGLQNTDFGKQLMNLATDLGTGKDPVDFPASIPLEFVKKNSF